MTKSNYAKYRGKCKEFCEAACKKDPTLTLVRGHYYDPFWDKEEQHWWTIKEDGTIYDPTRKQFPSGGAGQYIEFGGIITCAECGKHLKETEAHKMGNYLVCSPECAQRLVGL